MAKLENFNLDDDELDGPKPLTCKVEPTDEDIDNLTRWVVARFSVKSLLKFPPVNMLIHFTRSSVTWSVLDSLKKLGYDWESVYHSGLTSQSEIQDIVLPAIRQANRHNLSYSTFAEWDFVRTSLEDFCYAYEGSFFPQVKKWKYIKHKPGEYPYHPAVDLWKRNFVASFDGRIWRLHSGPKADIVYESDDEFWAATEIMWEKFYRH